MATIWRCFGGVGGGGVVGAFPIMVCSWRDGSVELRTQMVSGYVERVNVVAHVSVIGFQYELANNELRPGLHNRSPYGSLYTFLATAFREPNAAI